LRLERVALSNFRNYAALDLELAPGLNLFVGANAQGKSNLLEAIAMLGTGKSFRTSRDGDLVRAGTDDAVVHGDAALKAGTVGVACSITKIGRGTRKRYTLNGCDVRYASFLGKLRVVTFVPTDLQLATGAPSLRRAFLNAALSQDEPGYYRALVRYRKALVQKNAVLRAGEPYDEELLEVYDRALVESGTDIMLARGLFVRDVAHAAAASHGRFTAGAERLELAYEPDVAVGQFERSAVASALRSRLETVAAKERARQCALAGPHRDDLRLTLDGMPLGTHGSQGQQRTAVLALKVAEYGVMHQRAGQAPLLLLDDVLSELDTARAQAFLSDVGDCQQAFVTATHQPAGLSEGITSYAVVRGQVHAEVRSC
jgi:DNA replication and repair protein RecF